MNIITKLKVFITYNSKKKYFQEGVTLLISVLVMAGLALISLSVASFSIQELRSSRAVLVTEPAISAAETAGEQGLWAVNRGVAINPCPTATNPNPPQTNQVLGNGAFVNTCKSYQSATLDLSANTPSVFFLYDPNDINGNVDLLTYPYNTLTVTHKSGQLLVNVNLVRVDGTPVGSQPVVVPPGGTQVINIPAVSSGSEGRMKVTLQSAGNATVFVNTNQGLPSFPTINAGGCASKTGITDCSNAAQEEIFNRRINITVGGGLAGFGDVSYATPIVPPPYPTPYPTPSADSTAPVVTAFDVQPRTTSGSVTATFTATDSGSSHLKNADLLRATVNATCTISDNTGCTWAVVGTTLATAGLDTWSGSINNTPTQGFAYIYSLKVYDNAANVGAEPTKIRVDAGDASPPVVSAFDVEPRVSGVTVTGTFTATDTGGSHIQKAELWRATASTNCLITDNSGCNDWALVATTTVSNVAWTSAAGVTISGNSLTKTNGTTAWGDAGAVSSQTITSGDGYTEFSTNENNTHKMVGLSNGNSNNDYTDIDYAVYFLSDGTVKIYEKGVFIGNYGTYVAGDVFRVAIVGGAVKYSKNGTVFYTSVQAPVYPLLVDTSLFNNLSTITNVKIASASSDSMAGSMTDAPTAGIAYIYGVKVYDYQGNIGLEPAKVMVGDPTPPIATAFDVQPRDTFGPVTATFSATDAAGGSHLRNAQLWRATARVDCTTTDNSGCNDWGIRANLGATTDISWTSAVGVSAVGNNLTKTGGVNGAWDAGAVSTQTIGGPGYLEFSTNESNIAKMAGLSNGNTDQNYTDIDFALYVTQIPDVRVYEKGVYIGTYGTYVTGDIFRVAIVGNVVSYLKNGVVFYTSLQTPVFPLLVDTSIQNTNATITNAKLGGTLDSWSSSMTDSTTQGSSYIYALRVYDNTGNAAVEPPKILVNSVTSSSTTSGLYTISSYAGNGTFVPPAGINSLEEVLVVAGGGAGGSGTGGGGGGGGVIYSTNVPVVPSQTYNITVGAGGANGSAHGGNGGNSIFSTFTAVGGGGGGGGSINGNNTFIAGGNGGSGGGGGAWWGAGTKGLGTAGQGSDGANAIDNSPFYGGGGGGAGSAGSQGSGSNGAAGGAGIANSITGSSLFYGAGGGGGINAFGTGGAGGSSGVGGRGSDGGGGAASGAGMSFRGGGGGGGGASGGGTGGSNGSGGSGIVIIRYLTAPDTTAPVISSFDVQPRTASGPVTATFTATDAGGKHLQKADLMRTPYDAATCTVSNNAGCTWTVASTANSPVGSDTWNSGSTPPATMSDSPFIGSYVYGIQVYDSAGNIGLEPAKIKVDQTVNPTPPTGTVMLTSGTSWMTPDGVTSIKIWSIGAGGGAGGAGPADASSGSGGGAGGVAYKTYSVSESIVSYSLGVGGAGGAGCAVGSAGGNTTATVGGVTITGNGGGAGGCNTGVGGTGGGFAPTGATGGAGQGVTGDTGGGYGGGIGGGTGTAGTTAGGTGGLAVDVSGSNAAITAAGLSISSPGVGGGSSSSPVNAKNGTSSTGVGGGGGGAGWYGGTGGNGLYGGGGGGGGGYNTSLTGGQGGAGAVMISY